MPWVPLALTLSDTLGRDNPAGLVLAATLVYLFPALVTLGLVSLRLRRTVWPGGPATLLLAVVGAGVGAFALLQALESPSRTSALWFLLPAALETGIVLAFGWRWSSGHADGG